MATSYDKSQNIKRKYKVKIAIKLPTLRPNPLKKRPTPSLSMENLTLDSYCPLIQLKPIQTNPIRAHSLTNESKQSPSAAIPVSPADTKVLPTICLRAETRFWTNHFLAKECLPANYLWVIYLLANHNRRSVPRWRGKDRPGKRQNEAAPIL